MATQEQILAAGQLASALGTAAQQARQHAQDMHAADATLDQVLTPLVSQLEAAVAAVGKTAWLPSPTTPTAQ